VFEKLKRLAGCAILFPFVWHDLIKGSLFEGRKQHLMRPKQEQQSGKHQ
jgi:hypothetical protein